MKKNNVRVPLLAPEEMTQVKTIAMMNNKGGCRKTTTALALGMYLVRKGNNVLFFDNDPQSNLTQRLGIMDNERINTRLDCFFREASKDMKEMTLLPVFHNLKAETGANSGQIGLMAGSRSSESEASHLDESFKSASVSRGTKLRTGYSSILEFYKDKIDNYKKYYNFILLDTAPSIEGNSLNTLSAQTADEIIIPVDGLEAAWGMRNLLIWLNDTTRNLKKPNVLFAMTKSTKDTDGVTSALTLSERRSRNTVFDIMKKHFPDFVCESGVRELRSIRDGIPGFGPKTDYTLLSEEILSKISNGRSNIFTYITNEILDAFESDLASVTAKVRTKGPKIMKPYYPAGDE